VPAAVGNLKPDLRLGPEARRPTKLLYWAMTARSGTSSRAPGGRQGPETDRGKIIEIFFPSGIVAS
jgi:hypothetical protein